MVKPLTYYHDRECAKRCPVNEEGEVIIDWGETIPGQKKKQELFVKNESRDKLVLRQPYALDEDLHIRDYPNRLLSAGSGKVILEFTPKKERIDAMHSDWGFEVIIG